MADRDTKAVALDVLSGMVGEGGDLGYMEDALPALTAFLTEIASPDFACVMVGGGPPLTFEGVEGLAAAWRDWGEAFENVRAELEQVIESEDHIVLLANQIATTRHQGVEISHPSAMVARFEGGRLTALEFHLDRTAALRSAGLEV